MKTKSIILGLGEYAIITQPQQSLKIYALGSCIGLFLFDPKCQVVGMAHIVHPESASDTGRKKDSQKAYFADEAVPLLIDELRKYGGSGQLIAKLVGGSNMIKNENHFQIGKRNLLAVKKHLWRFRVGTWAEDVGGSLSRTVTANLQGELSIKLPGQEIRIL